MQIFAVRRVPAVRRWTAVIATAFAVLSVTVTGAAAVPAPSAATPAVPSFDFRDCPEIPAGVDAAAWKCEVLTATGSLRIGSRGVPHLAPITLTHAEGPLPDGSDGQVWGAMRSGPTAVPGGLTGTAAADRTPRLALSLRPEYGGRSDFYSVGDSLGLFTMRFRLSGPLLPRDCVIGAGDAPVELRLIRTGDSQRVSDDPPVISFDASDDTFTVPSATGCGPLRRLVDERFGLPAAGGNAIALSAYYTFETYDRLQRR